MSAIEVSYKASHADLLLCTSLDRCPSSIATDWGQPRRCQYSPCNSLPEHWKAPWEHPPLVVWFAEIPDSVVVAWTTAEPEAAVTDAEEAAFRPAGAPADWTAAWLGVAGSPRPARAGYQMGPEETQMETDKTATTLKSILTRKRKLSIEKWRRTGERTLRPVL